MTTAEKICAMEALWDDLCRTAGDHLSPDWHREVLAQRQASVVAEDARFEDWQQVKTELRNPRK
ncbi:addiction module antitoxin RelB [Geothermobacter hydrogeniphilus]|uniref:Addiction module antitoxin RelB n=2 Tax=Geothermobacter hydrogeniphilus TaxID=1969733 RepID=A0A1X0XJ18_9BACT|nr:addiction module antitoxin RelB [Geothermobacter hydrogeniphilus]